MEIVKTKIYISNWQTYIIFAPSLAHFNPRRANHHQQRLASSLYRCLLMERDLCSQCFFFYKVLTLQFPWDIIWNSFISGCTFAVSLRLKFLVTTALWSDSDVDLRISSPLLKFWKWNDENWNEFEFNTSI